MRSDSAGLRGILSFRLKNRISIGGDSQSSDDNHGGGYGAGDSVGDGEGRRKLGLVNRKMRGQGTEMASRSPSGAVRTATKTEDQVESGLLLDVVIGEGPTVFELLSGEDQTLLVRRDSFLVLDLGLDVVDGVGALDLESYGLAG